MKHSRKWLGTFGILVTASALALTGCSTGTGTGTDGAKDGKLTPVTLQLQWVAQAQFAGYYAAVDQGFYEDEGLDVTIMEGGADIVPQDVLASGDVDYAISWVPKVLGSIEQGANITNVAQIFERSATTQISF
ncbi:MAG: ABC transporter substrate-binding protein, partial [Cryobacterium sp.]